MDALEQLEFGVERLLALKTQLINDIEVLKAEVESLKVQNSELANENNCLKSEAEKNRLLRNEAVDRLRTLLRQIRIYKNAGQKL